MGELVTCPNCGRQNRLPAAAGGVPHCGACTATLPWLTESSEAEFAEVVEQSSIPVLVDFWAPWCAPCRYVSPLVEKMAQSMPGRLKVVKVNTDNAQSVAMRFGIRGIPTLILFDRGKEAGRVVGAMEGPELSDWVEARVPQAATS
jgi:thioredoxin 2